MRIFTLGAAALLGLGACSDSSGPNGPLSGDWTYEVLDARLAGDPVSCSFRGIVIRLEQRGSRLTGRTDGGFGTCARDGEPPFPAVPLQPARIDGRVEGTGVTFLIGDFILNDGVVADDGISGTARLRAGAEGTFTMRRR